MTNGKRICVCAAKVPFVRGGAENLCEGLLMQLRKRGFLVELIELPYQCYPEYEFVNSAMAWRLIDLEESNGQKIDLCIGTKFPSYAVNHSNKVAWIIHQARQVYDMYDGDFSIKNTPNGPEVKEIITKIDNVTLNECKKIFTISKTVSARLKKFNAIESPHLYHPPKLEGNYFNVNYGDYILSVGRLDPLKRTDLLIKALPFCPGIKAIIAGTGPNAENLKALAAKLNVADRVEFAGFVPDDELPVLYANAFAVYYAPLDEDLGYVTLEGLLSQKPIVTCEDSGGVLEFALHEETGLISVPDPEKIAVNINRLYANKNLCEAYGMAGFDAVKNITWDNVIEHLTQTL